jgi:hypothetical protein
VRRLIETTLFLGLSVFAVNGNMLTLAQKPTGPVLKFIRLE